MIKKFCDVCKKPINNDRPDVFSVISINGHHLGVKTDYALKIKVLGLTEYSNHSLCPTCFLDIFSDFYETSLMLEKVTKLPGPGDGG